jgi:hypothetical protein
MERRQFVSHLASLLALSMGAESLTGCATVGGVRHQQSPDPRGVVAEWDAQVGRLRAHGVPRELQARLRRSGLSPTFIEDGFGALLVTAGFRDLPRHVQQDPLIQARLRQELPRMADTVLGMTAYLESLTQSARAGVQRTLRRDSSPVPILRQEVEQIGRSGAVDPERVVQTLGLVDHVDFRLKRQDPSLFIDDTVARVDKAVSRVGGDRRGWSPAARGRTAMRKPSELTDSEVIGTAKDIGTWTLALGGLLSVGGLVTLYGSAVFGRDAVALFGVAVWTFGSLVFILGLVIMVAAELGKDLSHLRKVRG